MSLIQKIKEHQLQARILRDVISTDLLTTLLGEASMVGKNAGRETTDAEVVAVVQKFIKGIDETTKHVTEQGDVAILSKLIQERAILKTYLPQQLTPEQIESYLRQAILHDGLPSNKGSLMKYLKENFTGQYDGKVAAATIDAILA